MSLPKILEPWRAELELLPLDVAESLEPAIRRLSAALGPLAQRSTPGVGEPDGFDGIARRGPWDRLLLSEWALADTLPNEFLRRAAEREQGFLRLRRVAPQTGLRCVVLLDGGPSQLGEPRLAHFALLVVMSRRARTAGAELHWGILQQRSVHHDLSKNAIRAFRNGAQSRDVSDDDRDWWRGQLQPEDEIWCVGTEMSGARTISIAEPFEPSVRRLDVVLDRRSLRLDLPAPAACARVLRSALSTSLGPWRERLRPGEPQRMWFSADGNRLLLVGPNQVAAVHVPNSVNAAEKPGHTRYLDHNGALGVGYYRKNIASFHAESDALVSNGGRRFELPSEFAPPEGPVPVLMRERHPCLIDANGAIVGPQRDGDGWRLAILATDVGLLFKEGYVLYRDGLTVLRYWSGREQVIAFGHCRPLPGTILAVLREEGSVVTHSPAIEIEPKSLAEIWGVSRWHDGDDWNPHVVGLRADRRTIGAHSAAGPSIVAVADSDIVHGAICPTRPQVACMTAAGSVYTYNLAGGTLLREVTP